MPKTHLFCPRCQYYLRGAGALACLLLKYNLASNRQEDTFKIARQPNSNWFRLAEHWKSKQQPVTLLITDIDPSSFGW